MGKPTDKDGNAYYYSDRKPQLIEAKVYRNPLTEKLEWLPGRVTQATPQGGVGVKCFVDGDSEETKFIIPKEDLQDCLQRPGTVTRRRSKTVYGRRTRRLSGVSH